MTDRDRTPDGKPQNARPRDALGRPLPPGEEGVERVPEDLDLDVEETIAEGQRLLDHGYPFHAHEVFEAMWKKAPPEERPLWQGLAQLAVGLTHLLRGNPTGAESLLKQGQARVRHYEDEPPYRLDIDGLASWADHLLTEIARDEPIPAPPTPRLRMP
ncbi:DUF309 domain-containing protein [Rhodococcus pyridinivorans]|uniref:DUF309 domain-containing protein n=1 Tax=Rhodococcus pyridinivorans TaxID=103816 RepID=UPI00110EA78C|nr:DUF309 domain-containing protein [Rhodococcus pyridinivorans]